VSFLLVAKGVGCGFAENRVATDGSVLDKPDDRGINRGKRQDEADDAE
jgi:hypothetical protein